MQALELVGIPMGDMGRDETAVTEHHLVFTALPQGHRKGLQQRFRFQVYGKIPDAPCTVSVTSARGGSSTLRELA